MITLPAVGIVVLVVILAAQAVFIVLVGVLLVAGHARRRGRYRRLQATRERLHRAARGWLAGIDKVDVVAQSLRTATDEAALHAIIELATTHVPVELRGELAAGLRGEPWVGRLLRRSTSRFWWRRLEAARLLGIVAGKWDWTRLRSALDDRHPAVQIAATAGIPLVASALVVRDVIERLPKRSFVLRLYQYEVLRSLSRLAVPQLEEKLVPHSPTEALVVWVQLADVLGDPRLVGRIIALGDHLDADVRMAVARALRSAYHPGTMPTLLEMLLDIDWRVRGQAARSLGTMHAREAIGQLTDAAADTVWWVRFRAALALAQLGDAGRQALRSLRDSPRAAVRDMANMVSGLSEGGVVELAEG